MNVAGMIVLDEGLDEIVGGSTAEFVELRGGYEVGEGFVEERALGGEWRVAKFCELSLLLVGCFL